MAGYGTRARRKHVQRHARRLGAHHSMQQAPSVTTGDQNSNHISESSEDDSHIPNSASSTVETPAVAAGSPVRIATEYLFKGSSGSTHGSVQEQAATAKATSMSKDQHGGDETAAAAAQTSDRAPHGGEQGQSAAPRTSVTDLGRGGHFWHGERYSSLLGETQTAWLLQLSATLRDVAIAIEDSIRRTD